MSGAGGLVLSQPNERSFYRHQPSSYSLSESSNSNDMIVFKNTNAAHSTERYKYAPPVQALYRLDIHIPVIGRQRFQLRIISETAAELVIDGMLKINDHIKYQVQPTTGEFSFNLSNTTKRVLKRFRTSVSDAKYCSKTDTPSIQVKPPLPTKINLRLKRIDESSL